MNTPNTDKYAKARLEYENLTHNITASKRNWQMATFILAVALNLSIAGLILTSNRSHVIPYVIEVDSLGRAMAIKEAKAYAVSDEKVIKAFLYDYIERARTIVADSEMLKSNLRQIYRTSIQSVQSNFLDPYYKGNDPFDYAQKTGTKHVEPLICLRQAENTYSIEWREIDRNYENQVMSESKYKALITIVQVPQTKEDQYRENPFNPFGFYITSISWSKLI